MYFILFKDTQDQCRWNLNAASHKIIATGAEGYHNRQDAIHGINLQQHAQNAGIYDKTKENWV